MGSFGLTTVHLFDKRLDQTAEHSLPTLSLGNKLGYILLNQQDSRWVIPIRPKRDMVRLGVLLFSIFLKLMPRFLRRPLALFPIARPTWIELINHLLVDFLIGRRPNWTDDPRHRLSIDLFRADACRLG